LDFNFSERNGMGQAVRQIKRDTRHYAKRQLTWFKADPEVQWRDATADRQKIFLEI
jgi:tRNA dimethylallyltransferase